MIKISDLEGLVINAELPQTWDVTALHPDYTNMLSTWQKCRAVQNAKAAKDAGTIILPKLSSHKDTSNSHAEDDYKEYKDGGIFYEATAQSKNAFVGMMFRKPVNYEFSQEVDQEEVLKEATSSRDNFNIMLKKIADETIQVNRVGILEDVETATAEMQNMSVADAERLGIKSYSVLYPAESIINWGVENINGRETPIYFVLREKFFNRSINYLNPKELNRWRLLLLIDNETGGKEYYQVVVSQNNAGGRIVDNVIRPLVNGKPLDYIPFWIVTAYGNEPQNIYVPFSLGLVEMNIGHFRNSCDYEQELRRTAIKTICAPNWDAKNAFPVGGVVSTQAGQDPFFLEASNSSGLADEMTKKEQRLAVLGSQILAQKGRYVEAAETAAIQSEGEQSIIGSLAQSIEEVATEILNLKLEWRGMSGITGSVKLNKDYYVDKIPEQQLAVFVQLLQTGKMSFETFYNILDKMEVYPNGWSIDTEIAKIEESGQDKYQELFMQIDEIRNQINSNNTPVNNANAE